jgi:Tol biopolymer transport system component
VLDFKRPARNGLYTRRASDGGDLVRVTTNPDGEDAPGDYSPDGRMLSFVRYDPARTDGVNTAVFVVGLDGHGARRISPWGPFHDVTSSWSPDGRWILYVQNDEIFEVHPDGSGGHQIVIDVPGDRTLTAYPAWSPDGKWIAFSMSVPSTYGLNVYTMRPDGSDVHQVTTALAGSQEAGEGDEYPDWGPLPS